MTERICSLPDCDRPFVARGFCNVHYLRFRKHGDPLAGARERHFCTIAECDSPVVGRGWCMKHYTRWKNHGDPLTTSRIVGDDVARFESYLILGVPPAHAPDLGPCWLWAGGTDDDGYGKFRSVEDQFAHRWSYTHHIGPIPHGLELDHLCRVRRCANAWHLEPVTRMVNILRAAEVRYGSHTPNARPAEAAS